MMLHAGKIAQPGFMFTLTNAVKMVLVVFTLRVIGVVLPAYVLAAYLYDLFVGGKGTLLPMSSRKSTFLGSKPTSTILLLH